MKRKMLFFGFTAVFMISAVCILTLRITKAEDIPPFLKPSPVFANVPRGAVVYTEINGKAGDLIVSGTKVEILKDRGTKWYYVRYKNRMGWVKAETLDIPRDRPADTSVLSNNIILDYANNNIASETQHFIWVDIDRQRIYVLKGSKGSWSVERRIVCATGANKSPTTRGHFKIGERGTWFYSERLGSGAMYWVRFNGSYLFHSVAMDRNKNITDPVLGQKHSSGCVRMSVEDAKWFFDNIEENSAVWVC